MRKRRAGVANGGLLCVTCTDMRVLAGQQPDICLARCALTCAVLWGDGQRR